MTAATHPGNGGNAPGVRRGVILLGAAGLALVVLAAYANSLSTPFVFDDLPGIIRNQSIRSLWSPGQVLWGSTASPTLGRPVVNLSLALNYAVGGLNPWGYHLANVFIHIGAALVLFGIVRRTLARGWAPGWLRGAALPTGFCTALLWGLHPLQTESVTGVIQRTESLAGLIYLLACYCLVRATEADGKHPLRWLGLGVAACFAGMATKEIMVSAPLLLLLYDRTFAAGSFRAAGRERGWFHAACFLSWALLALLMLRSADRGGTVAFGHGIGPWTTLLTQSDAVAMYLKLACWPHPLVVDYGTYTNDAVRRLAAVWPQAALLVALAGLTLWALVRRPAAGFAGAWFFGILAPSSSFVPLLTQTRAEHRMYLPLAAVVLPVVILVGRGAGRAAPAVFAGMALALGITTAARNRDYRSAFTLWTDTLAKRPDNARAHFNLGVELARLGDRPGAIREYREALRLQPVYVEPHLNLFGLMLQEGRIADAREHAEAALRLNPDSSMAHNNLGHALMLAGDLDGALRHFATASRLDPTNAESQNNAGYALLLRGSWDAAIGHFRRAVALDPQFALARINLGGALLQTGRLTEARDSFAAALRLQPDNADARRGLSEVDAALVRSPRPGPPPPDQTSPR